VGAGGVVEPDKEHLDGRLTGGIQLAHTKHYAGKSRRCYRPAIGGSTKC
jgi:hypothetical protein